MHAEFVLADGAALYTPACFLGRMLVDRQTGKVESLEMHVPTDKSVNVDITLTFPLPGHPHKQVTNMLRRVDPMELSGGDGALAGRLRWQDEIGVDEAQERLKGAFTVHGHRPGSRRGTGRLEIAREVKKPILLVVLTSPLDDQSC